MKLTTSEDVRLAARPIQNPRAFELYLEARAEMRRLTRLVRMARATGLTPETA